MEMQIVNDFDYPLHRKTLHLIIIVDISKTMLGQKISSVYQAIRELTDGLRSGETCQAEIRVNVLYFNHEAKWLSPTFEEIKEFKLEEREACGMTFFENAFTSLRTMLRDGGMFTKDRSYAKPVIFLLSDGFENGDQTKLEQALQELHNERRFADSLKAGLAIGVDADQKVLTDFTGTSESVFAVRDGNFKMLKDLIRVIAFTLTDVSSKTTMPTKDVEFERIKKDDSGFVVNIDPIV